MIAVVPAVATEAAVAVVTAVAVAACFKAMTSKARQKIPISWRVCKRKRTAAVLSTATTAWSRTAAAVRGATEAVTAVVMVVGWMATRLKKTAAVLSTTATTAWSGTVADVPAVATEVADVVDM